MKSEFVTGAAYLLRGFQLIRQQGVRRYVIIPMVINTLLFMLLIWYGASQFNHLLDWLLPQALDWLQWLLWPLFALATLLILFYACILVTNLIGAPFNGLLAAAVERHLTGTVADANDGWMAAVSQMAPALLSELRKLCYAAIWSVPFLLLFVIPLVNVIAPLAWMAFTAWMLSLEYLDYPMGNHGLLFPQQRAALRKRRLLSVGFGGATMILTMIPLLNFFAMPTAVAGATVMWVEQFAAHTLERRVDRTP